MENLFIIIQQIVIMFIYMAIGAAMFKGRLITAGGSRSLANLLLYIVLPSVVLNSFLAERTKERLEFFAVSFVLGAVLLLVSMAVAHLFFRKRPIDDFGAAFSNAGFMGFPLITALLGKDAIFYAAGYVAMLNALQWIYGQYLLSGDKKQLRPAAVIKNPILLSLVLGFLLFCTGVPVPDTFKSVLTAISGLNAPVAMIILGVYLGQLKAKEALKDWHIYAASLARLIVIPILSLLILNLLPERYDLIARALFIVCMAPVGCNVAVYAQKQNREYPYAVALVCVSTLLSSVTMPLLMLLI